MLHLFVWFFCEDQTVPIHSNTTYTVKSLMFLYIFFFESCFNSIYRILLQKQGILQFSLWPQTPLIYIVGVVSVIDQGNFHITDNIEDFTVQCVV